MNNTPTPRTDDLRDKWIASDSSNYDDRIGNDILNSHETLELQLTAVTDQLTAAREEIENLQTNGIHSCHDNCQRPNCVLRRELKAATEQRDRLGVALNEMWPFIAEDDYPNCNTPSFNAAISKYKQALQSLNQNAEVRHGAKAADLD